MSDHDYDHDHYHHVHALLESDQIDWLGDGVLCQLVTIELFDELDWLDPVACRLPAAEARELAFRLLSLAEHAERRTRGEHSE